MTVQVNGQGVKVIIEDQGVCAVYTADTVEEALTKAADFDPFKFSSSKDLD